MSRVLARLGLRDGPDVPLSYELAPVPAARLANRLDRRFGDPPRDGGVVVEEGAVRVVEARPGNRRRPRRATACAAHAAVLRRARRSSAPVPSSRRRRRRWPRRQIERLLDGPRRVRFGDAVSTLTPARLRTLVGHDTGERLAGAHARSEGPRRLAPHPTRRVRAPARRRDVRRERQPGARRAVEAGTDARGRADRPLADEEPELDHAPGLVLALAARVHDRGGGRRSESASASRSSRPTTPAASRA